MRHHPDGDRDWMDEPGIEELLNTSRVQAWERHVRRELIPKIRESAVTVSLVPNGDTDVKFAVELGFSIMLGKPIILIVTPGTRVPDKLVQIADEIVEVADISAPADGARIAEAIHRIIGDSE
jgi:nucleoside 2-deoxyribosyltransferase